MGECRRLGLDVLGPDLNESQSEFSVTPSGALRFGLGAIKGVGGVDHILAEREENGPFKNVFDLTSRVKSVAVNKKNLPKNPATGGIPARENRANIIIKLKFGFVLYSPS